MGDETVEMTQNFGIAAELWLVHIKLDHHASFILLVPFAQHLPTDYSVRIKEKNWMLFTINGTDVGVVCQKKIESCPLLSKIYARYTILQDAIILFSETCKICAHRNIHSL